jgi:hypothetical protein
MVTFAVKSFLSPVDDFAVDSGQDFNNVLLLNTRANIDAQAACLLREYQSIKELPASRRVDALFDWNIKFSAWTKLDVLNASKASLNLKPCAR